MLSGFQPPLQALLGTTFTWGLTALGALLAVFLNVKDSRKTLDASLGFAAGVMMAASYWSLLAPALDMAANDAQWDNLAFVPVAVGFILGALFVFGADRVIATLGIKNPVEFALKKSPREAAVRSRDIDEEDGSLRRRRRRAPSVEEGEVLNDESQMSLVQWKRILLLLVAITVHNIPEGLAVGVGFGAVGKSSASTFTKARNLAIGIGIQNFPEGLAVSLPLKAAGFSNARSVWYGQLSGLVEPIAGVLGAILVSFAEPLLPYALAFAAGAMIYVVVDDLCPEMSGSGNGKLASLSSIVGFVIMMSLDVGLG